jgi:two-component system chemotaxis response regulator CheB
MTNRHSVESPLPLPIIAIGGSAGAIKPVLDLLSDLPTDLRAIILVVIHRTPGLPSLLPDIIARRSPVATHLARDGIDLKDPICLVAPPDRHMAVTPHGKIHLVADGYYRGNSIDLLFNSLARSVGPRTIGVIVSGLLKDGAEGLRAIREAGGLALVQSPAEAQYADMPENAINADGPVDFIGPVSALAKEIRRRVEAVSGAMELSE